MPDAPILRRVRHARPYTRTPESLMLSAPRLRAPRYATFFYAFRCVPRRAFDIVSFYFARHAAILLFAMMFAYCFATPCSACVSSLLRRFMSRHAAAYLRRCLRHAAMIAAARARRDSALRFLLLRDVSAKKQRCYYDMLAMAPCALLRRRRATCYEPPRRFAVTRFRGADKSAAPRMYALPRCAMLPCRRVLSVYDAADDVLCASVVAYAPGAVADATRFAAHAVRARAIYAARDAAARAMLRYVDF